MLILSAQKSNGTGHAWKTYWEFCIENIQHVSQKSLTFVRKVRSFSEKFANFQKSPLISGKGRHFSEKSDERSTRYVGKIVCQYRNISTCPAPRTAGCGIPRHYSEPELKSIIKNSHSAET